MDISESTCTSQLILDAAVHGDDAACWLDEGRLEGRGVGQIDQTLNIARMGLGDDEGATVWFADDVIDARLIDVVDVEGVDDILRNVDVQPHFCTALPRVVDIEVDEKSAKVSGCEVDGGCLGLGREWEGRGR